MSGSGSSVSSAAGCRQNYHADCELAVNKLIKQYLETSYLYSFLATHFERDDQALLGTADFFKTLSCETNEQAQVLLRYQIQRGGRVALSDIAKPDATERTLGAALEWALEAHKQLNLRCLEAVKVAESRGDVHLGEFIEDDFSGKEVDRIKRLADRISNARRVGSGLGHFLFDKLSL